MSEFIQEARRPLALSLTFLKSLKDNLLRSPQKEVKSVVTEVQERKTLPYHFNPYTVALFINLLKELDYIVYIWVK